MLGLIRPKHVVRPNWPGHLSFRSLAGWLPSGPLGQSLCTGAILSQLHAVVGPLIHVRLNDAFWSERCCLGVRVVSLLLRLSCGSFSPRACSWLLGVLYLGFKGVFFLHFCSNSCITLFSRWPVELALFWINMRVRNVSSPNFLIKLTVEIICDERQQDPPHFVFARPQVKVKTKVEHHFRLIWYLHTNYSELHVLPVNLDVSTIIVWVVEEWNNIDLSLLHFSAICLGGWKIFEKTNHSFTPP
jgi:hypothetical protein